MANLAETTSSAKRSKHLQDYDQKNSSYTLATGQLWMLLRRNRLNAINAEKHTVN
ncbi:hypothetical protein KIN20_002837 [Parelaphostrongylus tenuis]|uniref:Uncharacterized protein n=1 Tax=Parelaphostrongylus tenuis TaxID=148309 RepID=A0AAD5LYA8_PARTN|nr:hypothetical protein KIN20_002837 [Parelaphostrongylus tenuis]